MAATGRASVPIALFRWAGVKMCGNSFGAGDGEMYCSETIVDQFVEIVVRKRAQVGSVTLLGKRSILLIEA